LNAVSVDPSEAGWGSGPPPLAWLAGVNRQSLAVRLLATTVHDVNNILQVMSGAAEVLALDPTPAAVAKRTTSIVGQSAAATAVLHNLITFVRAESPAHDGARPLVLAQQALAFRQHAFKKLRLAVAAEGDDVECLMARQRLQQVLLNLVVNAEQALAGRANATLRLTVQGEGEVVRIVVADNGPGLTVARQAAAFAWPPSPGETPGALGLGLQVSRGLVTEAAGTFAIEAPPDGGTAVVVTLPRLRR
jgi:two-component system, NtrC family, C4-dicarboxylate transport sensor histidine kinase DctB